MTRRITVADAAVFCSLLLGAGIVMGIFGHIYTQNLTVRNRQKWGDDMVKNMQGKKQQSAKISYHTDDTL